MKRVLDHSNRYTTYELAILYKVNLAKINTVQACQDVSTRSKINAVGIWITVTVFAVEVEF